MNVKEIIDTLQTLASITYKENVVRMGIPEANSIGVSTTDIRKVAKTLPTSNDLAFALWDSQFHEARILAVLLFDKNKITVPQIEELMNDIVSWDLCDHLCKNIIIKMKGYEVLIPKWLASSDTYYKRGAFTLMASTAIHHKNIEATTIEQYLVYIKENAQEEHEHIKKAISWALREIGKIDFMYNEKAILLAHELKETGNKTEVCLANDVLKELENVVKVDGRRRLLSARTKMGNQQKDKKSHQ